MSLATIIGILGGALLVIGAALPEAKVKKAEKSLKNRFFSVGSLLLLVYAFMGYLAGGAMLIVGVEVLIVLACIMMLLDIKDTISQWIVLLLGIVLFVWSMATGSIDSSIIFILGGIALGLGYISPTDSSVRNLALTVGGALVVIFSYLGGSWILLWLNVGFTAFCLIYLIIDLGKSKK